MTCRPRPVAGRPLARRKIVGARVVGSALIVINGRFLAGSAKASHPARPQKFRCLHQCAGFYISLPDAYLHS